MGTATTEAAKPLSEREKAFAQGMANGRAGVQAMREAWTAFRTGKGANHPDMVRYSQQFDASAAAAEQAFNGLVAGAPDAKDKANTGTQALANMATIWDSAAQQVASSDMGEQFAKSKAEAEASFAAAVASPDGQAKPDPAKKLGEWGDALGKGFVDFFEHGSAGKMLGAAGGGLLAWMISALFGEGLFAPILMVLLGPALVIAGSQFGAQQIDPALGTGANAEPSRGVSQQRQIIRDDGPPMGVILSESPQHYYAPPVQPYFAQMLYNGGAFPPQQRFGFGNVYSNQIGGFYPPQHYPHGGHGTQVNANAYIRVDGRG